MIDVNDLPEDVRKQLEKAGQIPRSKRRAGVTSRTTAWKDVPAMGWVKHVACGWAGTGECLYCPEREGAADGEVSSIPVLP